MKSLYHFGSLRKASLGLLLGTLGVAFISQPATAQDKDAPLPKRLVHTGYTRPGIPSDGEKEGKVIPAAWDLNYKGMLLGGSVYFAVFERTGAEGDVWGTGMANFDARFKEGRSYQNNFSPALDTK